MTAPKRIQRQRTKGWRMPEGAVYVGRPTMWGNPFYLRGTTVLLRGVSEELFWAHRPTVEYAREEAATSFGKWLDGRSPGLIVAKDRQTGILASLEELRGHDLACWCPLDQPCHADVLLELANPDMIALANIQPATTVRDLNL